MSSKAKPRKAHCAGRALIGRCVLIMEGTNFSTKHATYLLSLTYTHEPDQFADQSCTTSLSHTYFLVVAP